ncbi:MAG TPA: FHA domain-containing protein, partial [Blastocatellia bacterium]|nr:FHA domain-containing protein [Blastocatellia bacterium]
MDVTSSFIISRRDTITQTDDVRIETQGLTIGRLGGNDLVLNHRAVSRTHAGIKKIGEEFWLFNLSTSNGTMLNGEIVDRVPLADGDTIQIGPYVMKTNYAMGSLKITIEMELEVHPVEGAPPPPKGAETDGAHLGTMMVAMPRVFNDKGQRIIGSAKLTKSGLLTGVLPAVDERALNVFWDKRKREAGKLGEKSRLQPRGNRKVGKAQFNWGPTLDLSLLRRKSFFAIGGLLIAVFAFAGVFVPDATYSPGKLSSSHSSDAAPKRGIAIESNGASCSSCHSPTSSIDKNCASCHTIKNGFQPTIYQKHQLENMGCVSCHAEHRGTDIRAGLIAYNLCSSCHNGVYRIKAAEKAGTILPVPHGGSVGYPVTDGNWTWPGLSAMDWSRRGLPFAASETPRNQFHLVHQTGRMQNRMNCTDCHTAGTPAANQIDNSPRAECAKCHSLVVSDAGGPVRLSANCGTCHQQHGESEDTTSLIARSGQDAYSASNIRKYVASLDAGPGPALPPSTQPNRAMTGGAAAVRQQQDALQSGDFSNFGALPWYAWLGAILFFPISGIAVVAVQTVRRNHVISALSLARTKGGQSSTLSTTTAKLAAEGPSYPHPVIDPALCIGCHACVEACPHDVLAIVNGIASPIALDQCMEDTGCQVECPTSPKACVVVNTKKKIPPRKVPDRDSRFMTGVKGMY